MNPAASPHQLESTAHPAFSLRSHLRRHWSIWTWAILLLIINLPLVWGDIRTELLYLPQAVDQGEWWRTVTYPLVHLSWYHLLLDAGGFLLLFGCLEEKRYFPKALYIMASGAGSLMLAYAVDPSITRQGLSGLSGIAHGLMAVAALEMLRHKDQRRWGWISLFIVVAKSAYELWSGQVLFDFIHMGMCGQPLAASHAGGVMGALLAFALIHTRPGTPSISDGANPAGNKTSVARRWMAQTLMRITVRAMTRIMYRVRYHGLEHIPDRGAAVLVCNHVSYVDWLIIASACRRPVHFVMHASIYRIAVLRWIFRMANVIPIESGRRNPAALRRSFEKIASILQNGDLVCIFPEGRLTLTGQMNQFRPGIEKIIQQNQVPVVPLALRGLWGSFFSHKNGPAMRCRPRKIWAPIDLTIGRTVQPCMATARYLHHTVEHLNGDRA